MGKNIFDSFKKFFKEKTAVSYRLEDGLHRVNVTIMEKHYEADDFVGSSIILKHLLEIYGTKKKMNHRLKGRVFVHFILSNKHKNLKTIGYTHWQNINKIIHLNHAKTYPYHKNNLRKAMDFYKKELKSINSIDVEI